jgi:hypothetical protein
MFSVIARLSSAGLWAALALSPACGAHALGQAMAGAAPASVSTAASSATVHAAPDAADAPEADELPAKQFSDPNCPRHVVKQNCPLWTAVVGYPVEQAKQRARAAGYTRDIEVRSPQEFDAACKAGTVCSMTPTRWELNDGDILTLWVNHAVTISSPQ